MLESTVQWKKENLRSGLVQMYSVTVHTHSKMFARVQEEKYVLLLDYPCTSFYYVFPISFGGSTRRDRLVDDFLYSLYLSASQRTHIVRRS